MSQNVTITSVVIPSGANSVALACPSGVSLRAIDTPASFEGTTLTFQAGYDPAGPGKDLYDGGSLYSIASGASRYIPVGKPDLFLGAKYLKIVSNVAGVPSNVAAARTLVLTFTSE
ncbi:MAG: hypothetical protein ACK5QX_09255, partial [bacterium]